MIEIIHLKLHVFLNQIFINIMHYFILYILIYFFIMLYFILFCIYFIHFTYYIRYCYFLRSHFNLGNGFLEIFGWFPLLRLSLTD